MPSLPNSAAASNAVIRFSASEPRGRTRSAARSPLFSTIWLIKSSCGSCRAASQPCAVLVRASRRSHPYTERLWLIAENVGASLPGPRSQ